MKRFITPVLPVLIIILISCSIIPSINNSSSSSVISSSTGNQSSSFSSQSSPGDLDTFYVSTNGNDTNAGSKASPLRSINIAVKKAGTNYTKIYIGSGLYNQVEGLNGASDDGIYINSKNNIALLGGWDEGFNVQNGYSILEGKTNSTLINAENVTNIVMMNLFIKNGIYGIYLQNCSYIAISNVIISNINYGTKWGIRIGSCNMINLMDCTLSDNGYSVVPWHSTNISIRDSSILFSQIDIMIYSDDPGLIISNCILGGRGNSSGSTGISEFYDITGHSILNDTFIGDTLQYLYHDAVKGDTANIADISTNFTGASVAYGNVLSNSQQSSSGSSSSSAISSSTVNQSSSFSSQSSPGNPGIFYVSTNGNDTNAGSKASPLRSISGAVNKAGNNSCQIYMASGIYSFYNPASHNPVDYGFYAENNFKLYGGWDDGFNVQNGYSILDGSGLSIGLIHAQGTNISLMNLIIQNGRDGIDLFGSFCTLSNIIINNNAPNFSAALYIEFGNWNNILDCQILNSSGNQIGINIEKSQNISIINSSFQNNLYDLYLRSSTNLIISNCTLGGNGTGSYAIYEYDDITGQSILYNTFIDNTLQYFYYDKVNGNTKNITDINAIFTGAAVAAGNSVSNASDITPPVIVITSPVSNQILSTNFTVYGTNYDLSGISGVTIMISKSNTTITNQVPTYLSGINFNSSISVSEPGNYYLQAIGIDHYNNTGKSAVIPVKVVDMPVLVLSQPVGAGFIYYTNTTVGVVISGTASVRLANITNVTVKVHNYNYNSVFIASGTMGLPDVNWSCIPTGFGLVNGTNIIEVYADSDNGRESQHQSNMIIVGM